MPVADASSPGRVSAAVEVVTGYSGCLVVRPNGRPTPGRHPTADPQHPARQNVLNHPGGASALALSQSCGQVGFGGRRRTPQRAESLRAQTRTDASGRRCLSRLIGAEPRQVASRLR